MERAGLKETNCDEERCDEEIVGRVMLIVRLCADSIFHDPESGILFASFKYIGYDYAGDSKEPPPHPTPNLSDSEKLKT